MGTKGYKAFNSDMTCRGFQYEVGKTYTHDGELKMCKRGFHFCKRLTDCFRYYDFHTEGGGHPRICEVEALGKVLDGDDGKLVTDRIRIVRELSWGEVLEAANSGRDNTGRDNSGNRNSGDRNSGDWNSGNWNSGNWNSGDWNSGNRNSGDWNSGNRNSGNWNSGDWNSGDWNSGNRNSGNRNSGNWNMTDFSSGVLCTEEPECLIFDRPSGMTLRQWRQTDAARLMNSVELKTTEWVSESRMSEKEKEAHPESEILGGYLKEYAEPHYAFQEWWDRLDDEEKGIIKAIPNFDAEKWFKITGIDVRGCGNE
jgi:hypothetical protein